MTQLILASSSPYRRELLARLAVAFECISPDIDESSGAHESPDVYVMRLAKAKAEKVGERHPNSIIIGSDQCSVNQGEILGKPKSHSDAITQLQQASGQSIEFLTGVCIHHQQSGRTIAWIDTFIVEFRELTLEEIERYLEIEAPYNCAGSFKSERLGIALCKAMHGEDPTALIGLPLIKVAQHLRDFGIKIP